MSMTNYDAWKTSPPDEAPEINPGGVAETIDELGRENVFGDGDCDLSEAIDDRLEPGVLSDLLARNTDDTGKLNIEAFITEAGPGLAKLCLEAAWSVVESDRVEEAYEEAVTSRQNEYCEEWDD